MGGCRETQDACFLGNCHLPYAALAPDILISNSATVMYRYCFGKSCRCENTYMSTLMPRVETLVLRLDYVARRRDLLDF